MTAPRGGNHAVGAQQEHEQPEQMLVVRQRFDVEPLVGPLVRAFVVQPNLPHRGDDDPIAGQVDRIAIALVHGGHLPSGKRPVQRVLGALALDGQHRPLVAVEVPQHGVGVLAVHLDAFFPRQRVALPAIGRPRVAQQADKEIRQEIGQQFLLIQFVGPSGREQIGPVHQAGTERGDGFRQRKPDQVLVHHVRTKQWLPFNRHGNPQAKRRRTYPPTSQSECGPQCSRPRLALANPGRWSSKLRIFIEPLPRRPRAEGVGLGI